MGMVIVVQFVTLDGVVEDPDGRSGSPIGGWAFRYPEAVAGDKFALGERLDGGVELLGRSTWQHLGRLFPARTDTFSTRLNRMEKLVASRSLTQVGAWENSTLLRGDLLAEVRRRRKVQDVIVAGSATVVDQLAAADLVDQYRLKVFPVVVGTGRRLFENVAAPIDLSRASSETTDDGVTLQVFDRVREEVAA